MLEFSENFISAFELIKDLEVKPMVIYWDQTYL
jgi:hypothetical protein